MKYQYREVSRQAEHEIAQRFITQAAAKLIHSVFGGLKFREMNADRYNEAYFGRYDKIKHFGGVF
jgi:hypothetical protein